MNVKKTKDSGFTLIEMLVVIAIIALLAAILVPTVTNALENANRTRTLSNGRGIYQAIFAAHLETINFPLDPGVWPGQGDETTSTAYFARLIREDVLTEDFGLYSAAGFAAARTIDQFEVGRHNTWKVTDGASNSSTSQLPFLITTNLTETRLEAPNATLEADRIVPEGDPYDDRALVVVRVGGGGEVIPGRALRWTNVNPSGAASPPRNLNDLLPPAVL